MKKLVVLAFTLLLSPLVAQAADNPVIGTWRLQSYVREVSATGQRYNLFGDKLDGYIGYAPDGRMYALFINTDRVPPRDAVPTDEERRSFSAPSRHTLEPTHSTARRSSTT